MEDKDVRMLVERIARKIHQQVATIVCNTKTVIQFDENKQPFTVGSIMESSQTHSRQDAQLYFEGLYEMNNIKIEKNLKECQLYKLDFIHDDYFGSFIPNTSADDKHGGLVHMYVKDNGELYQVGSCFELVDRSFYIPKEVIDRMLAPGFAFASVFYDKDNSISRMRYPADIYTISKLNCSPVYIHEDGKSWIEYYGDTMLELDLLFR